jgi:hypothetical protein
VISRWGGTGAGAERPEPPPHGLRDVLADPRVVVDLVAPTLVFAVAATRAGIGLAAGLALGWCAAAIAWRLARRQPLAHAMSGLGGVAAGVVVALVSGDAEGFFLPGIVGNLAFGAVCVLSVLARRPALAYTSAVLTRWPLAWYWHPRVRPAYSEVTWLWAAYYLAKGGWQAALVADGDLAALATVRIALGWPGLALLLALTYAYVRRRLDSLDGPDVDAWRAGAERAPAAGGEEAPRPAGSDG